MHVVVLLWCSADGSYRIPVAFRLWRPKRSRAPHRYQTKLQLAARMLTELVAADLLSYLVMDTHYTVGWFTHLSGRLGRTWVGTLPPKDHGHLARPPPVGRRAGRAAAPGLAAAA